MVERIKPGVPDFRGWMARSALPVKAGQVQSGIVSRRNATMPVTFRLLLLVFRKLRKAMWRRRRRDRQGSIDGRRKIRFRTPAHGSQTIPVDK